MRIVHATLACLLVAGPSTVSSAEAQSTPTVIRVAGSGEVELAPDFVQLEIGVRVQAPTADQAAQLMSDRIDAVVDTLAAMGVPRDSLPTRVFSISSDRVYPEGNRITGYTAHTTLRLRTFELRRVPELLGGTLRAGATEIGRVQFGSTRAPEAREQALRMAVAAAEREASIIASARGGRLGRLIEIGTVEAQPNIRLRAARDSGSGNLPPPLSVSALTPQQIVVSISVTADWELAGGGE